MTSDRATEPGNAARATLWSADERTAALKTRFQARLSRCCLLERAERRALRQAACARAINEGPPANLLVTPVLVGASGFEPPTSATRTLRSTRLSHAPMPTNRTD